MAFLRFQTIILKTSLQFYAQTMNFSAHHETLEMTVTFLVCSCMTCVNVKPVLFIVKIELLSLFVYAKLA